MSPITAVLGYRVGKVGHKGPLLRDIVIRNGSNSLRLAQRLSAVADQPRTSVCYSKSHPNNISRTRAQEWSNTQLEAVPHWGAGHEDSRHQSLARHCGTAAQ